MKTKKRDVLAEDRVGRCRTGPARRSGQDRPLAGRDRAHDDGQQQPEHQDAGRGRSGCTPTARPSGRRPGRCTPRARPRPAARVLEAVGEPPGQQGARQVERQEQQRRREEQDDLVAQDGAVDRGQAEAAEPEPVGVHVDADGQQHQQQRRRGRRRSGGPGDGRSTAPTASRPSLHWHNGVHATPPPGSHDDSGRLCPPGRIRGPAPGSAVRRRWTGCYTRERGRRRTSLVAAGRASRRGCPGRRPGGARSRVPWRTRWCSMTGSRSGRSRGSTRSTRVELGCNASLLGEPGLHVLPSERRTRPGWGGYTVPILALSTPAGGIVSARPDLLERVRTALGPVAADRPLGAAEFTRLHQVARLAVPYAYSLSGHVLYTDIDHFQPRPTPRRAPRAERPARHRPAAPLRRRDLRGLVGARARSRAGRRSS